MTSRKRLAFRSGSVLLISVLILAAIMLRISLTGSHILIEESQIATAIEKKKEAVDFVTGCLEHAMKRFTREGSYMGDETYPIGSVNCTIFPIQGTGPWTIQAQVMIGNQRARFQVGVSQRTPLIVSSWTEVAAF